MMEHLAQILVLLGVAVAVVIVFQRLHIPTSLGYLLVGVILGPNTIGPAVYVPEYLSLAEFGVVFLLFTIGLNYSLPQLHALRDQVLWLGTGQVVFTTLVAGTVVWLAGLPPTAAFVVGAVFAQSSTTIIGSLLAEQREDSMPHGRLGLAMSVFQDVTAVPFLVIIPVLGVSVGVLEISTALGWAMSKAVLAFALVFFSGRWLLRPLFHVVTERRSAEVFTLAVLLVALLAAWGTSRLGLSLAFGGFLAGMMLGETEFRHQIESSIRPFRDVLLGLFFIGIGMRIEPAALPPIWHWVLLGTLLILVSKIVVVMLLLRRSGVDAQVAWRTGLLLSVGGEFGFALMAIALDAGVIALDVGQVAMTSVLFAMIAGAFLIRFNDRIASLLARVQPPRESEATLRMLADSPREQVLVGGYGRVGQTLASLLQANNIPFVAFDTDPKCVALGRKSGHAVMYGDISDPDLLKSIRVDSAALVVLTINDSAEALKVVSLLHRSCPLVPVIARARDSEEVRRLLDAGATRAWPEVMELSLGLGTAALQMLSVRNEQIELSVQDVRDWRYESSAEGGRATSTADPPTDQENK